MATPFQASHQMSTEKKSQVWSSCKAHEAMEWQGHFKPHATPQMGRTCDFLG
jgi:hypothetical protein